MRCPPDVEAKLDVSRETLERLTAYVALIEKWNKRINLISKSTVGDIWHRHILDSVQVWGAVDGPFVHWADLGSGGGLPGIVVAILASEQGGAKVTLVEADQRKASFLRAALRETGAKAEVLAQRIDEVPCLNADIMSARALAPLERLLEFCDCHLAPGGTAVFPKGARANEELEEARQTWSFDCEALPSATDDAAVILRIGEIQRV